MDSVNAIEQRVVRRMAWRILPYLFVLYVVAYLDRVNVAFAKTEMMKALGFSEAVFGFGAGLFFLGYFLLEIPGALIVERWSARKWIARILLSWGVCTVLIGFVQSAGQFYTMRFLLGAAEAGFFPGVIVYLTHWFPAKYRARAMGAFILAVPLSFTMGAPISGFILTMNWLDIPGWRWVFILEGVPAILFGVITVFYLKDRPKDASWLDAEERRWLESELEAEKRQKSGKMTAWRALRERNVLILAVALFVSNVGSSAFFMWLPETVQRVSGLAPVAASWFTAVPFLVGVFALMLVSASSDRTGKRKLHAAIAMMVCGLSFAASALFQQNFLWLMVCLSLTASGLFAATTSFWVLPTTSLGATAAATAVGLINSVGNLGGFFGPTLVGQILTRQHSFPVAIVWIAGFLFFSGILILTVRERRISELNPTLHQLETRTNV